MVVVLAIALLLVVEAIERAAAIDVARPPFRGVEAGLIELVGEDELVAGRPAMRSEAEEEGAEAEEA